MFLIKTIILISWLQNAMGMVHVDQQYGAALEKLNWVRILQNQIVVKIADFYLVCCENFSRHG